jgi:hypothetical protein
MICQASFKGHIKLFLIIALHDIFNRVAENLAVRRPYTRPGSGKANALFQAQIVFPLTVKVVVNVNCHLP